MNTVEQDRVLAPNWGWFRRIWMVVTIVLVLMLVFLAVLGFGPGGRNCPLTDCGPALAPLPIPGATDDLQAPSLSLHGDNPVFLKQGEAYDEAGVSAVDDADGEIPVGSSGKVDSATPGRYTLTYSATDQAGNTSTLTRLVIVDAEGLPEGVASAPGLSTVRVYFAPGRTEVPADVGGTLSPILERLFTDEGATVVVAGFNDATGDPDSNQQLARARAESVRDHLVAKGVDVSRVMLDKPHQTQGSGRDAEGRHVELRVIP
ncbi:immunoglobulin-like domain-containing protein [Nitrogeniibacter aestuarii]|uniref:immunoglobulin-like domain-containing protein n=1 Tax=Nitrogeniibacter aestuarii TaxID=2815343 RepID=UPI001D0F6144|nr:immunoglobulin-like domain-containing protein [Nitrogeniibacter aestuarii]